MPQTIEIETYAFDELDEEAKARARDRYRQDAFDHDWFECVYDDFGQVCELLGMSLRTSSVRLAGGGARSKPNIYFRGFWSQGDGACFEGTYRYSAGAGKGIRAHAPKDTALHRIADELTAIQRRNFYQLEARAVHRGHYYHEYCMAVDVDRSSPHGQDITADAEDRISEAFRDLARWLYRQLEHDFEHLNADDTIDDAIRANGFRFRETGVIEA
jgi:hypothetical protein